MSSQLPWSASFRKLLRQMAPRPRPASVLNLVPHLEVSSPLHTHRRKGEEAPREVTCLRPTDGGSGTVAQSRQHQPLQVGGRGGLAASEGGEGWGGAGSSSDRDPYSRPAGSQARMAIEQAPFAQLPGPALAAASQAVFAGAGGTWTWAEGGPKATVRDQAARSGGRAQESRPSPRGSP